jgi:predicted transcriptional regulator
VVRSPRWHAASANFPASVVLEVPGTPLTSVLANLELLDEVRRRLDLGAYARDRERSALALAASAGFEAPTVTVVRLPVHHASVDAYLDYRASFGRLAFVPEDRQDEWVAMLREVSKERQGPDGAIDLDWTIALLHATSTG